MKGYHMSFIITLALSLLAVVLGIMSGEATATFRKAVSVCLSCIGIG